MNQVMKPELRKIIQYLNTNSGEYVSSSMISNLIGFSSKTTAAFLKEIDIIVREQGAYIDAKTGFGYRLQINNQELFNEFLNQNIRGQRYDIDESVQIVHYMIREFLVHGPLKMAYFEDNLFMTRTSVNKYYKEVNDVVERFHLRFDRLSSKGNSILGAEHNLRCCINYEVFYFLHKTTQMDESFYDYYLNCAETETIRQIIIKNQREYKVNYLDDTSLAELANFLYIAHTRNIAGFYLQYDDETIDRYVKRNSYYMAESIIKEITEKTGLSLTENEVLFTAIYIIANRCFISKEEFPMSEGYMACKKLSVELVNYLAEQNNFRYIAHDEVLIDSLSLNLTQIVTQSEFCLYRANQIYYSTKSLEATLLATQCAKFLKDRYGFKLSQNQIGYLSAIIYPVFGRYPFQSILGRAIVVSDINKSVAMGIRERLIRNFGNHFTSVDVYNLYELEEFNLAQFTYIFSTYDKRKLPSLPDNMSYVYVNTFFNLSEKNYIRNMLVNRNLKSTYDYIEVIGKMRIHLNVKAKTKNDLYQYLARSIQTDEMQPEEVVSSIELFESFNEYSKKFNVVFVTPLNAVSKNPQVSAYILRKSIKWDTAKIQVVVFCDRGTNKEYAEFFENESLTQVLYRLFTRQDTLQLLMEGGDPQKIDAWTKEISERIIANGASFR